MNDVLPSLEFVIGRWMDERLFFLPLSLLLGDGGWMMFFLSLEIARRWSMMFYFPLSSLGADRWTVFVLPFELSWSMNNVRSSLWVELIDEQCSFFPLSRADRWKMFCLPFELSWGMNNVLFSLEFVRSWSMNNAVLPSLEFVRSQAMDDVLPSFAFVWRWIFFSWNLGRRWMMDDVFG